MPSFDPRQVARLQNIVAAMRERVAFVEGSAFWKLRAAYFAFKARFGFTHDLAPPPIPAREYAEVMDAGDPYLRWLLEHESRASDLARLGDLASVLASRPSIEIVVDAADDDAAEAVARARAQNYPDVSVVVAGEARGAGRTERFARALGASNADWIAFVTPSELLARDAAFEVAVAAQIRPDADLVYGDRDTIDADGRRSAPVFAPDWSPEAFVSQMYTGRAVFFRRRALEAAGGIGQGFADPRYDMALRVTERAPAVAHRARILHSVRTGAADVVPDDDARAISAALARRGEPGVVTALRAPGAFRVRRPLARPGRVEILVPTRDHATDLERCLDSLFARTTYRDFAVTVIDNGSVEPRTAELLSRYAAREPGRFAILRVDEPFNFSRLTNAGARATSGPYLLLLNNDTEVRTGDWLEAMLDEAQRAPIGAVGARLLYGDGTVQHAGVAIGLGALAGHVYRFALPDDPGPGGALLAVRNYSAVTAACMMVRRDAFDAAGGFDDAFAIEFNDIDFCLRLRAAGYRNVYLPHVELVHYESKSRGTADTPAKRRLRLEERTRFTERWQSDTFADPYYNPALTRIDESGTFAP